MHSGEIDQIRSATPAQQGYIIGTLSNPGTGIYIEQAVIELHGEFSDDVFKAVFDDLFNEHPALRTVFAWDLDDFPRSVILSRCSPDIRVLDCVSLDEPDYKRTVFQTLEEHRSGLADLTKPPLFKLSLLRRDRDRCAMVWSHHHALLDGWSQMLLLRSMLGRLNGERSELLAVPWSSGMTLLRNGPGGQQEKDHWSRILDDFDPPAALPCADIAGPVYRQARITMPAEQLRRFAERANELGVSTSTMLVAIWSGLVAHLWDTRDVVTGLTTFGRAAGEENIVGAYARTIPLRNRFDIHEDIYACLGRLQAQLAGGLENLSSTPAQIHDWLGIPKDKKLYDTVIAIANHLDVPTSASSQVCIPAGGITGFGGATIHAMSVVITFGDHLDLRITTDRRKIGDEVSDQILKQFEQAILAMVSSPLTGVIELLELTRMVPMQVSRNEIGHHHLLPRTESLAHSIASVFASTLGLDGMRVDANFFLSGGHSLAAIELLAALRQRLDIDLTLGDLVGNPTPLLLAEKLRQVPLSARKGNSQDQIPVETAPGAPHTPFPLTDIQQAYWIGRSDDFDLGGVDAQIYAEIDIPNLDLKRLENAWRRLIERHEMLRAVLTSDGEQIVLSDVPPYEIGEVEITPDHLGIQLDNLRKEMSCPRRDVTQWPLFCVKAVTISPEITRLFLSFDMLIGDAKSWLILHDELQCLYEKPDLQLAPLEISFRNFVTWSQENKSSATYNTAKQYWQRKVAFLPSPPPLPRSGATETIGGTFKRRSLRLDAEQVSALNAISASFGVTPTVLLLTCFSYVLSKKSSSSRFIVNITTFNRPAIHSQIDCVVGDFTSLTIFEVLLRGELLEADAKRNQRYLWEDLDSRAYSGIEVLRDCASCRSEHTAPAPIVFTSTLGMERRPRPQSELQWKLVYSIGQTPQVTLDYQVHALDEDIFINWDAVDDAFPEGFVDELFHEHSSLLGIVLKTGKYPREPGDVADATPEAVGKLLHSGFLETALRQPLQTAIIDGETRLSYRTLRDIVLATARSVPDGKAPVGILMNRGWRQTAAALSISCTGRPFVPLAADWPLGRIADVVRQTGMSDVLVDEATSPLVAHLNFNILTIKDTPAFGETGRKVHDTSVGYIIFTSGSTGSPKGVAVSHRAAVNTIEDINKRFEVTSEDRILSISSLTFDLSIYDIFGTLAAGGTLVTVSETDKLDPEAWADLIERHKVTIWNSVPLLAEGLLKSRLQTAYSLNSIRLFALSGDWIPLTLPGDIRKQVRNARIVSLGGATEAAIWSIYFEVEDVDPEWKSIPYGYALSGQVVEVLDEDLQHLSPGIEGEIYISGKGLADGYWRQPHLTADAFLIDRQGRRLYRTGDWGRLCVDGSIEFLGRRDDQVKVGGHRIETKEIEVAASKHPAVISAVAGAYGDRQDVRLFLFYAGTVPEGELRKYIQSTLPQHMVPSFIERLVNWPMTGTGKLDRQQLRDQANLERSPAEAQKRDETVIIRDFVSSLVGRYPDMDENLMGLGLTSIDAMRLANRIKDHLGATVSLRRFYRKPTLNTLFDEIRQRRISDRPSKLLITERSRSIYRTGARNERETRRDSSPKFLYEPFPLTALADGSSESDRLRRVSSGGFGNDHVSGPALLALLECLRAYQADGKIKFQYASAGGLYNVNAFVHIKDQRVTGFDEGVYYYHPGKSVLLPVLKNIDLSSILHLGVINGTMAMTAAFTIFLTFNRRQMLEIYDDETDQLALLNAGYIGQLLMERSTRVNLGLRPLHGFDFDRIRWLFPDGDEIQLLHLLVGGNPGKQKPGEAKNSEASISKERPRIVRSSPLSPGQERLIWSELMTEAGSWPATLGGSNLRPVDFIAIKIHGDLKRPVFQEAVISLFSRHSVLRTQIAFPLQQNPVQIVHDIMHAPLEIISINGEALGDRLAAWRREPIENNLFRIRIFDIGDDVNIIVVGIHHLISDGWSPGLLLRDLAEFYNAAIESREPNLPEIKTDFNDFCDEMYLSRRSKEILTRVESSARTISSALPERPFGKITRRNGGVPVSDFALQLSPSTLSRLRLSASRLSDSGGLSVPILVAIAAAVQEISGAKDVAIGNMISGRTSVDAENLAGYYVNTGIIIVPDAGLDLIANATSVAQQMALLLEEQDLPIQDILSALGLAQAARAADLPYQTTLALNSDKEAITMSGLETSLLELPRADFVPKVRIVATSVVLRWVFQERPDGLFGQVTYNLESVSEEALTRGVKRFYSAIDLLA